MRMLVLLCLALATVVAPASAQVGNLIWEESFDSLDNWIIESGNGSWGWGNGELQYYSADNVAIAEVPGEPGTAITRCASPRGRRAVRESSISGAIH
jgi:hypothetical protein